MENNSNYLIPNVHFSIDRFEKNIAVCENTKTEKMINIPKNIIETKARAGDMIILKGNKYVVDPRKTNSAKKEIKNLANSLFKK